MISQHILVNLTDIPQFNVNPDRYYLYFFLKAITGIGTNIIPLVLGYYSYVLCRKNVMKQLSNFYLTFFFTAMLCNLFSYIIRSEMSLRDFWIVLFPISQNYFSFSVSCILGLLLLPKVTNKLNDLESNKLIKVLIMLTVLLVVIPTLFGKDVWGLQEGTNVLWIFYLMYCGYIIKRFDVGKSIRFPYINFMASIFLLLSSIYFMTSISMLIREDTSTAFRFCVPYSPLALYYTVILFDILEIRTQNFFSVKASPQVISTFLISTQVILNWPLVNYIIKSYYKKSYPDSGNKWAIQILLFIVFFLIGSIFLTIMSLLMQRLWFYRRLELDLRILSLSHFSEKLLYMRQWLYNRRKILSIVFFFYLFTIVQFLIVSTDNFSVSNVFKRLLTIFVGRQSTIFLTVFIIIIFFLFLFLLTNRFWYSFTVTLVIDLLLTISTILKISLREEPILPSDMKMLNGVSEILNMVNPVIIFTSLGSLLFLTISTFFVQKRVGKIYFLKLNIKKRIGWLITILILFSGVFFVNHKNSPTYIIFNLFRVNKTFFNQKDAVKTNGPLIQFLINVDVKIMEKPERYSKSRINIIMKKYNEKAKTINLDRNEWPENQTIIFCLSESFSNPSRLPHLKLNANPIPNIINLKRENTGGLMMSVGYGGGTANMEWESLTGLNISNLSETLVTPYTQLVDKQPITPNVTNLFEEKIAIHPFTANLYRRKDVFEKLGFEKFYYEGSPNKLEYSNKIDSSPQVSDEAAYNETLKHINDTFDKTQFIQLSTMQNHMPYSDYYEKYEFDFTGDATGSWRKEELRTYLQGIHYTDIATQKFIEEIDKIEKPITFVFYGDHLPSIYSGLKMTQYGLQMHQTDYFIYNNKFSREHSKKLNKKVVSTSDFPAMALSQSNLMITPFYALLTEVSNKLPAATIDPYNSVSNRYNGSQVFINSSNKVLSRKDLDENQKEVLEDYMLIQYDLTAGNQYSAKWASMNIK